MEYYLNQDAHSVRDPYEKYRMAIWIYLFLLIFEGALRKWVLPQLATPLLIVRDPIVIWLYCVAIRKGWLNNIYVKVISVVSTVSLLMTLICGHQNLAVGIFGWRIYFFHLPMIFIIAKLLSRKDVLRIGTFILYISIPMTFLIISQFYSPQSAWVNIGIGGIETEGFAGANGRMRPPGTFSFTSGYGCFQRIVCCFLLFYLIENKSLPQNQRFSHLALLTILTCFIIAIPTSISRTVIFQTIVLLTFVFVATMLNGKIKGSVMKLIMIVAMAIIIVYSTGIADENIEVMSSRYEAAGNVEGGLSGTIGNRYLGGLLDAFTSIDVPFWGYGIGLGTNVGSHLMGGDMYSFGFNGENEWTRIVGECGYLVGWTIILIRLSIGLFSLKKSYICLIRKNDILPWILCGGLLLSIPQGQLSVPTNLGFCVLSGGLTLASMKKE